MFHKVNYVRVEDEYRLRVQFAEGVVKIYDVEPLFEKYNVFSSLRSDMNMFNAVRVDVGGYGISWTDSIDLSCDELWEHGTVVETVFDELISFGDATQLWGLNESTLRKAVSYGNLLPGRDVCKYGKQWVISRQAMVREYGMPPKEK